MYDQNFHNSIDSTQQMCNLNLCTPQRSNLFSNIMVMTMMWWINNWKDRRNIRRNENHSRKIKFCFIFIQQTTEVDFDKRLVLCAMMCTTSFLMINERMFENLFWKRKFFLFWKDKSETGFYLTDNSLCHLYCVSPCIAMKMNGWHHFESDECYLMQVDARHQKGSKT